MAKRSGISPRFSIMLCEFILVSIFFHVALSFDISEDDSHQNRLSSSHSDKQGYWTFVEEKSPSSFLPNTRLGRRVVRLPQTLNPRIGRFLVDPEVYDYDVSLVPDYSWNNFDYPLTDSFFEGKSIPNKRDHIAFPARFGRKKRSISDDDSENENHSNSKKLQGDLTRLVNSESSFFEDIDPYFYMRQARKGNSRSRNAFVPRVGKKRSYEDLEDIAEKRALALTPRIGRASLTPRIGRAALIPRIGRNDPRFEVKSRGSFIPRIGRRASFTPRIGKSTSHQSSNDETK